LVVAVVDWVVVDCVVAVEFEALLFLLLLPQAARPSAAATRRIGASRLIGRPE
jgi:hypothetical protein